MGRYPGRDLYHLELRDLCAKSKRECDSLRYALQFSVRRRSSAESYQRNGRLLQDRLANGR
jgi:hypothetical protein